MRTLPSFVRRASPLRSASMAWGCAALFACAGGPEPAPAVVIDTPAPVIATASEEAPEGNAPASTPRQATPGTEVPTPEGVEESVGIAECDAYIGKLRGCLRQMAGGGEAMFDEMMKDTLASWRDMARTPEGASTLRTACKSALDSVAQMMACNP